MIRRLITLVTIILVFSCKEYQSEQIKPIIWGCSVISAETKLKEFSSGIKEPHPLDLGRYLFYSTYMFEQTNDSVFSKLSFGYLDLIQKIQKDPKFFDHNSFKYNFSHGKIKAGWWSGMANAAMVAGLTYADEVFGSDSSKIINSLISNLSTSYKEGGSLKENQDGSNWILEYAWDGMDEESIKSVFNGFVFSLVCLEAANQIEPNPKLNDLVENGLKALNNQMTKFYFEEVHWTKYDLVPTIESPHYAIFDIMLLESLNELLPKKLEWIANDIKKRRDILKNGYRLELYPSEGENFLMLFSLIGPPHPYWIDVYPIELEISFMDRKTKILKSNPPKSFEINIHERGFMKFDLTKEDYDALIEVKINAVYSGQKQEIFVCKKEELSLLDKEKNLPKEILTGELNVSFDGIQKNDNITIDPERKHNPENESYKNNIAQIAVPFKENQSLLENENLILKVENNFDISSHKIYLYTESGKVFERYYLPIKKGKNLMILNTVGFSRSSTNERIKRLVWRIYTHKMNSKGLVKFLGALKTKNNMQLRKVFEENDFHFEEKKVKGNIY